MLYINIDTNLCLFQELKNQLVDLKDTNETTALDMIHADNVKHGRDKYKTLKVILYKHRRSFLSRFLSVMQLLALLEVVIQTAHEKIC